MTLIKMQPHNNQSSHETATHPVRHIPISLLLENNPPSPPGSPLANKARMLLEGVFYCWCF